MAQIQPENSEDTDMVGELDTLQFKYVVFRLGDGEYAFAARHISEIVGMQRITAIPNLERHVRGVMNLRGRVIPVVDTRLRFGFDEREYDEQTCILLAQEDEYGLTGFIVDEVLEVADIYNEQIVPPPKTVKGTRSRYIEGMARNSNRIYMILNLHSILRDNIATTHLYPSEKEVFAAL